MLASFLTVVAMLLLCMAGNAYGWSCYSPLQGKTSHEMYINGTKAGKIQKEGEDGWSAYCLKEDQFVKEGEQKFYGKDFSAAAQAFCKRCEEP